MNLFPSIGPAERKIYLKFGRDRAEGRKQRQKNYLNKMNTDPQWIPLTGPGSRKPTEADGSDYGCVHVLYKGQKSIGSWSDVPVDATHFCPIAKAPPLPKPVVKSQEEKDMLEAARICELNNGDIGLTFQGLVNLGIRYGRSDGRRQLAEEALGLCDGDGLLLLGMAEGEESAGFVTTGGKLRDLHALLTKAKEAHA